MKYIVVHVSHDFNGYVEGVECLSAFDTPEDAQAFIQVKRDTSAALHKTLVGCIETFVNGIVVPEFKNGTPGVYQAWQEWLSQWPCNSYNITPDSFKHNLKSYLISYWPNFKHPDFNVPDMTGLNAHLDLFVVEVCRG
jgi:hypothetical protein